MDLTSQPAATSVHLNARAASVRGGIAIALTAAVTILSVLFALHAMAGGVSRSAVDVGGWYPKGADEDPVEADEAPTDDGTTQVAFGTGVWDVP